MPLTTIPLPFVSQAALRALDVSSSRRNQVPCAYWDVFDKDKIVWPDIGKLPRFSLDRTKLSMGNTVYCVSSGDPYLLGVLSSWATWFFISKTAQPLRLRGDRWQYRLFTQFTENIPIPDASYAERNAIGKLAELCNARGDERHQVESQVRHRLTQNFGINENGELLGNLNEKAQGWWEQPLLGLGAALKQSFKMAQNPFASPKAADEWETYLKGKKAEADSLRQKLTDAEAEINERVYKLFALAPDEIKLLQREVEH